MSSFVPKQYFEQKFMPEGKSKKSRQAQVAEYLSQNYIDPTTDGSLSYRDIISDTFRADLKENLPLNETLRDTDKYLGSYFATRDLNNRKRK